ncbi:taste receptor type 1 member 1-like [Melanotaenia boesemani]|uniref:taste receptor type 1 member 1-like n=1 Tax=Melanotaenia boesemani TaxID=1250792 RepID=UPI001C04B533|nr:taste receptor type 1 member 1-like [Melanotaenia boesemani]
MKHFVAPLCLVGLFLIAMTQCTVPASEFQLDGDYLIGGLFDIHQVSTPLHQNRPQALSCSSEPFLLANYRRFQLMRFSIEEINNSTSLLPNVSLGYEMFDYCSNTQNFPGILKLISVNDMIQPWAEQPKNLSKVIGVVGPFTSTQTLTVAPLFMADFIPLVSYGGSASVFSNKIEYPSFLRTVYPNKNTIDVIVNIILHFNWRWVAFLNSDNDFGIDGLELFIKRIKDTKICLAYNKGLNSNTNHSQIFQQIEGNNVKIIVVFAPKTYAEAVIESAIKLNVNQKVWIADDGWSLNKKLQNMEEIKRIGTVLGVSQPVITIPGFNEYIYSIKSWAPSGNAEPQTFCNQVCNCSDLSADYITAPDPSFSFPVYSAVYAIAHALHNTLKCGAGKCDNITVHPHMVLKELKKSSFTLLNQTVHFDKNGDPKFGSFSIVFWNQSGGAEEIGFYHFYPSVKFYINATKVQWYSDGEVPTALCSPECQGGHVKKQTGVHKCCFNCEICPSNTYVNSTENPFKCINCMDTEWSTAGSTSCSLRLVEYIPFTDTGAIVIMVGTCVLVGLSLAVSVLFAINYNTPVVRSAGGPMCFLILICLGVCSFSVFFYFGQPTPVSCVLRYFPFILFYTVCLACFVVRSFQIVCIFKMAAKIPKFHSWWMKYHGQWLLIAGAFVTQAVFLISIFYDPPRPYNETSWYPEQTVLFCGLNLGAACALILPLLLCCLCFIFSYMGKDLPKNYNEAKAITFCLLLLIFTWIIFVTVFMLYRGKNIQTFNGLAVLSSLYSFLLWYFLPKCYIIIFQPHKNTQQYFQGLIQNYTKTISQ